MVIDRKHNYKFCMKYFIYVKNYKHGERLTLWGYIWQT